TQRNEVLLDLRDASRRRRALVRHRRRAGALIARFVSLCYVREHNRIAAQAVPRSTEARGPEGKAGTSPKKPSPALSRNCRSLVEDERQARIPADLRCSRPTFE